MIAVTRSLITLQLGITLTAALLLWAAGRTPVALSAAIGGGVGLAATWAGALALRPSRGASPAALLRAQFLAEFLKVVVTLGLFALAFVRVRDLAPLPLFVTYAATLAAYGIVLYKQS